MSTLEIGKTYRFNESKTNYKVVALTALNAVVSDGPGREYLWKFDSMHTIEPVIEPVTYPATYLVTYVTPEGEPWTDGWSTLPSHEELQNYCVPPRWHTKGLEDRDQRY